MFILQKVFIYISLLIVFFRLYTIDIVHFWAWLVGIVLFALTIPLGKWKNGHHIILPFLRYIVCGILICFGMIFSGMIGPFQYLFFILLALSGKLPRKYYYLCIIFLLALNYTPFLTFPNTGHYLDFFLDLLPGQFIFIIFSKTFWKYRIMLKDNKKLLEELLKVQKELHPLSGEPVVSLTFTRREKEVIELIAKGYSNKEISDRLCLAEGTIKNRVSQILGKTGVKNRTQAALMAKEIGII